MKKKFKILVVQMATCCRRDYYDYFKVYTIRAQNKRKAKEEARCKWVGNYDPLEIAEFKLIDISD